MRLFITLIMLGVAQLLLNVAHASPQTTVNARQHNVERNIMSADERRKRRPLKAASTKKVKAPLNKKSREPAKSSRLTSVQKFKLNKLKKKNTLLAHSDLKTAKITLGAKAGQKHPGRLHRNLNAEPGNVEVISPPLTLSKAHHARYKKARETVMNKLMDQLGKPYVWGGASPRTGFDCSGLVWYAYKDLVKFKIPRTANEMYHLRDAAPVRRDKLEKGDLVFFRINGRAAADHVGVYLGGGKFIQSPRTGKDIRVSALTDDYWQQHYIGARRVMTPKTIL